MAEPFVFQPLDPATRRDPFALYARGRREQPAFAHAGLPLRVVSVFRHADVQAILRDAEAFSNVFQLQALAPELDSKLTDVRPPSMLGTDPPEHTRLRSLVGKAFTPRIVQRLEGRMEQVAGSLLDEALAKREVDLVEALSYPLPVTVIAEIIASSRGPRALAWSDQAVTSLGVAFAGGSTGAGAAPARALRGDARLPRAARRGAAARRARTSSPGSCARARGSTRHADDLDAGAAPRRGEQDHDDADRERGPGLVSHPAEQQRLRAEPALLPRAIEEVLRFSSPVQFAPRRAKRATRLHGVEIHENDAILCWIGSANRDETVFAEPERFDVARDPNPHLSFGFGIHYCLGANLARLEASVALGALLRRTRHITRR
jgi:cytochrome P450